MQVQYNAAKKHPRIIHYKPYKRWYYCQHAELFWKYASRTPFIDTIIEERVKHKELATETTIQNRILNEVKNGHITARTIMKYAYTWLLRKTGKYD
ncbi:MAG: hypothetical protein Ta2B_17250 [Termitinemataceae bacterium]|nr:MAG: hypothetical protein Ta2B_17250 [Termitinemataceae bacterium]